MLCQRDNNYKDFAYCGTTVAGNGAVIALGVLVAVLVLLLVLATGAMLYLLIMRGKHKEGNASQSR